MSKQKFTIILTVLIIVIIGVNGAALFVYGDDFVKKPVPSAGAQFDMYTDDDYDPNEDSIRFESQHREMEMEWKRIEKQCRDNDKRAREYNDTDYYY